MCNLAKLFIPKREQRQLNPKKGLTFSLFFSSNSGTETASHYLLVMAVSKDPVLLLRVKKQAEDIKS